MADRIVKCNFSLEQFETLQSQNDCQMQPHVLQGCGDIPLRKQ